MGFLERIFLLNIESGLSGIPPCLTKIKQKPS